MKASTRPPQNHYPRPTREQQAHLDRVLEVLVWAAWLVLVWNLLGFLYQAFLG